MNCSLSKKKSIYRKIILMALVIIFLPLAGTMGQSETLSHLSLEEALGRALKKNNLILSSKYAYEQASWNRNRAWAELFPSISFNTRYMWIDDKTYAERDFRRYLPAELRDQLPQTVFQETYSSSIDLNMPLFNGVLLNGLFVAYENEDMAEKLKEGTEQETAFQVIKAYLDILKTDEIVSLQEEYLELSKMNYEKAERLFRADRYSQAEALRWKVDYQQQKSTLVNSQSIKRSAVINLERLINARLATNVVLEDIIPASLKVESDGIVKSEDTEIIALIDISDEELTKVNSRLAAGKSGKEISKLMYKNSYSSYLPNVSLSYSYGWRENNTLELDDYSPKTLMVNLSIPIFSGFQNYTKVKSTYYEYKKAEEDFKDQLLSTRMLLQDIANRLINLKTQKELTKLSYDYAEKNYRIVKQQKEQGILSNIDFIDAKLNLQNAKLNKISAEYDLISTMVELYYMLGKINQFIL